MKVTILFRIDLILASSYGLLDYGKTFIDTKLRYKKSSIFEFRLKKSIFGCLDQPSKFEKKKSKNFFFFIFFFFFFSFFFSFSFAEISIEITFPEVVSFDTQTAAK